MPYMKRTSFTRRMPLRIQFQNSSAFFLFFFLSAINLFNYICWEKEEGRSEIIFSVSIYFGRAS